jgi:hypothetical protein
MGDKTACIYMQFERAMAGEGHGIAHRAGTNKGGTKP